MGFQCYSALTPPSLAWHICEIQLSEWNPETARVGEHVFMPEHSSSVYKSQWPGHSTASSFVLFTRIIVRKLSFPALPPHPPPGMRASLAFFLHMPSAGVLYQGPGPTLGWHHDRDSTDALQGGLADSVGVCVQ